MVTRVTYSSRKYNHQLAISQPFMTGKVEIRVRYVRRKYNYRLAISQPSMTVKDGNQSHLFKYKINMQKVVIRVNYSVGKHNLVGDCSKSYDQYKPT